MDIIQLHNITKEYRLGQLNSLKATFTEALSRIQGRATPKRRRIRALDKVTLTVRKGEVLGIIGPNGAGKSTLLKLLAGVTKPSQGTIRIRGSVAPLIEVGAGLHPELTGRENIYLNGSILGIPRIEIRKKFDDIVKFAELEEFIETPTKRYSSGMKIRLGFAIATSVHTDILIVDEVLAVGDLAFQRKCFERMENLIKRQGNTVLLVSHNIRQVERICNRVILLDCGRMVADGEPAEVCSLFYQRSNEKVQAYYYERLKEKDVTQSSGEVEIFDIDILDEDGKRVDTIESGGLLRLRVHFGLKCSLEKPEIVVGTHTTDFVYLTASSTALFFDRPNYPAGDHEIEYIVPAFPLVPGIYCVRVAFFDQNRRPIYSGETLKLFSVVSRNNEVYEAPLRTLDLPSEWRLNGRKYARGVPMSNTDNLRGRR